MSEDPFLDQKGLFFVVDWDTRTLGNRHDKLRGAAKEFDDRVKVLMDERKEHHLSVVEISFLPLGKGTSTFSQIFRNIKLPQLQEK